MKRQPKVAPVPGAPKKKLGRPVIEYYVALADTEGTIKPRPNSMRREVLRHLLKAEKPVSIAELVQVFGNKVRDVESKLRAAGWVKRSSPEQVST